MSDSPVPYDQRHPWPWPVLTTVDGQQALAVGDRRLIIGRDPEDTVEKMAGHVLQRLAADIKDEAVAPGMEGWARWVADWAPTEVLQHWCERAWHQGPRLQGVEELAGEPVEKTGNADVLTLLICGRWHEWHRVADAWLRNENRGAIEFALRDDRRISDARSYIAWRSHEAGDNNAVDLLAEGSIWAARDSVRALFASKGSEVEGWARDPYDPERLVVVAPWNEDMEFGWTFWAEHDELPRLLGWEASWLTQGVTSKWADKVRQEMKEWPR